ncbi:MAG: hypothetical protein H7263_16980 [Candidatus Sericytochromatia bacterium]|nr:hypothetical protein [Candidatus Sericytochromatia bacterium]
MKKLVVALASSIILFSCSQEDTLIHISQSKPMEQSYTAQDYQAEKDATTNKASINSFAETIFIQNFADDISVQPVTQAINLAKNVSEKGSLLFRLLNKSKLSQKVGYFFADYPVRMFFGKKSKTDDVPKISVDEIAQLKNALKPGDIILCGNNGSFIHAILYFGNDVIIHSLATKGVGGKKFTGVIKETLSEYLSRAERDKFVVLRYKNLDQSQVSKMFDYASQQIGKSYDTLFLMNSDTRFYCTELVYQDLIQLTTPPRMQPHKVALGWELIMNEDFMDSPDFDTVWTLHKTRPATSILHTYN